MKLQTAVHQNDVEAFLNDYLVNSNLELIEASKESELVAIAKKHGIVLGSQDLGLFRNVYAFSNIANKNGARLPDEIFQRALPTIVMKPVNTAHKKEVVGYSNKNGKREPIYVVKRKPVVGVYFDYVYKAKEKMAITYGVFFKAIYPELWAEAQKMKKQGKLKSSYEVWCPDNKKKKLPDGTYELNFIEFAGGSLLFDDPIKYPDQEPAFDGATVLELARKDSPIELNDKTLEFANVNEKEIITANFEAIIPKAEKPIESVEKKEEEVVVQPKLVTFNLDCLECSNRITHIEEEIDEKKAVVRCDVCNSRYELTFADRINQHLKRFNILMGATVVCPQCHQNTVFFYRLSDKELTREVRCTKCSMTFPVGYPESKELKPIINIRELEPFKPEVLVPEISGTQLTQDQEGITISSQIEKVSDKVIENENTIQEDEVDKTLHYAAMRKAVGKYRELKKELIKTKAESDTKVEKIEKRVRKACGKYVGAVKMYKASKDEIEATKIECASKVEMYLSNANKLIERKAQLGKFAEGMTDEAILSDKDFEVACIRKENAELKARLEAVVAEQPAVVEVATVVKEEPVVATTRTAQANTSRGGYYNDPEHKKRIDGITFASQNESVNEE